MSSIIAQQAKLDLELVPNEKRLEVGKCNGRLDTGKIQREPTFQVVLDALALTLCYSAFLITADVPEGQDFDALPTDEEIMSFLRDLGHTGEISSLNDVVVDQMHQPWRTFAALINISLSGKTTGLDKLRLSRAQILWEETQIYGAILPESLTSPEMKETKAYKTYLVSAEEPTGKLKRVKRHAKKSTKAPTRGVVIRETPEMPLSKKKEKVDVTQGKGIELLSQVALNEDAQFEKVQRKSMRDFHKTHPSGSSVVKIIPSVTSEGTGVKPWVPDVTGEESSKSKAESWGNDEVDSNNKQDSSSEDSDQENDNDEEEVKDELVKTPSNDSNNEDETKITDKAEGDEDEEMDYTTKEGTDAAMTNVQQGFENPEILQVIEDIPHIDAEIVSPMNVHVHHEVPSQQTPTLLTRKCLTLPPPLDDQKIVKESLEDAILAKESSQSQSSYVDAATLTKFELKKILINKMDKSESYLAALKHRECYEGLKKSYDLDKTIFSTYGSSKEDKSQLKSSGKSVLLEEPEFKVADSYMPEYQEENLGNDDEEPKEKVASKCDWFTKLTQPQEPTDLDWNVDKTPQQGKN
nr:hypothetical protein [Tanacetum cinerariifolium]